MTARHAPTGGEIAELLRDHARLLAAAGGWADQIPADEREAWLERKADLLERIGGQR